MTIIAALIASCTGCTLGDNEAQPDAASATDADQVACASPTLPKLGTYDLTWLAICNDGGSCEQLDAPLITATKLQLSFLDKTASFNIGTTRIQGLDPIAFDNDCTLAIIDPNSRIGDRIVTLTAEDSTRFYGSYRYLYKDIGVFRTWELIAILPVSNKP